MGIESRDYYRKSFDSSGHSGWRPMDLTPVCKYLIIANVVVFLLQIFVTRPLEPEDLKSYIRDYGESVAEIPQEQWSRMRHLPRVSIVQQWFQLETGKVIRRGQIWRLLTCAFCHDRGGVWHILINMLFLYWFGRTLESMYGSREFLLFYLTAAVTASLAYVGLDLVTGESVPAIGASGAVMAVTMLYAIFYPRHTILLFFIIPIEIRWLVVFYVIFDLHPVLLALAGDQPHSGVAHAAHLGGLAFGFLYWKFNLRLEPYVDWLRAPRWDRVVGPRRQIRIHQPSREPQREDLDEQVDAILQKIHDHGEDSLTDDERQVLKAASDRYKNR